MTRFFHIRLVIIVVIGLWASSVLHAQPTITLGVDPDIRHIEIGGAVQEIAIIAEGNLQGLTFAWTLEGAGRLEGDRTSPGIFYILPESLTEASAQARVTVVVTDEHGQRATYPVIFLLNRPIPTPAPARMPSPTPEPPTPPRPTATLPPTATPTRYPTASPTPQPTATPTRKTVLTPTPKPTATSTPKPKPTATATPKPRPTATPTPRPTVTPRPRPTATPRPRPTATPQPTFTPRPQPTATPTPKVVLQITRVELRDENSRFLNPDSNGVYHVTVNQVIKITVVFAAPQNHAMGVAWTTGRGKIHAIDSPVNSYVATKEGGDYIVVTVWDKLTGDEEKISINLDANE